MGIPLVYCATLENLGILPVKSFLDKGGRIEREYYSDMAESSTV